MKRSDFGRISSYNELRMARLLNGRALKKAGAELVEHGDILVGQLSPVSLVERLLRYATPLLSLYERFRK